ncbi:DUF2986 domain-containing protein [Photobacterium sp. GSS17]|uniref:DUF2986 domain-containing protein n=1 Tax=Photobacterium sp. GSS17 TaxID=3020715 RepID=UPI002361522B|nr:DUF2986 domain-containing protein [Photobacterium sp. GSS17]
MLGNNSEGASDSSPFVNPSSSLSTIQTFRWACFPAFFLSIFDTFLAAFPEIPAFIYLLPLQTTALQSLLFYDDRLEPRMNRRKKVIETQKKKLKKQNARIHRSNKPRYISKAERAQMEDEAAMPEAMQGTLQESMQSTAADRQDDKTISDDDTHSEK